MATKQWSQRSTATIKACFDGKPYGLGSKSMYVHHYDE